MIRSQAMSSLTALWMVVDRFLLRSTYSRRGIEAVNDRLLRAYRGEVLLSTYGARVGRNVVVHGPLIIHNADGDYSNLTIGDDVHLGRLTVIDLVAPVVIERGATVSMGVTILTHTDVGDGPLRARLPRTVAPAHIGPGCYIGANATILPGCPIGREAVIGAGAVVTSPVPDELTVVGVPARPIVTG
jgi:acetyltransferase-like isoleucine patch superfamily enzyme